MAKRKIQYDKDGIIEIGNILKNARSSLGLSQDEVITILSRSGIALAKGTLSDTENGANQMPNFLAIEFLRKLLEPKNPHTNQPWEAWELLELSFPASAKNISTIELQKNLNNYLKERNSLLGVNNRATKSDKIPATEKAGHLMWRKINPHCKERLRSLLIASGVSEERAIAIGINLGIFRDIVEATIDPSIDRDIHQQQLDLIARLCYKVEEKWSDRCPPLSKNPYQSWQELEADICCDVPTVLYQEN